MVKFGEGFEAMLLAKLTGNAHQIFSMSLISNILEGLLVTTIGVSLWSYSL
jgi:hypothetical protein